MNARATIHLSRGRIVDATAALDATPVAVLDDVLEWKSGQFQLHTMEPEQRVVDLGVTEVLLEHAQRRDEAQR